MDEKMMSKKDMLTLGVLAIGGVAVASSFAGGDGDGDVLQPKKGRAGGILGSQEGYGAPTIYNLPASAAVTFPKAPTFDISKFLSPVSPLPSPVPGRGAAGVSAAPKKTGVLPPSPATGIVPYLYTGGDIKLGAYTPKPVYEGYGTSFAAAESIPIGGSTSTKKSVSTPKKYVRRSEKGYTYSKTGSLTKK